MDGLYFTGHDSGHGHSANHGSPDNITNNPNYSNGYLQQDIGGQDVLPSAPHSRHDSLISPSPSHHTQFLVEQHQAELQPCIATAQTTPRLDAPYLCQAQSMSRGASQWSNQSSTATVAQYSSNQLLTSHNFFRNGTSPSSIHMLRSASERSNVREHSINFRNLVSQPYRVSNNTFASPTMQDLPVLFPTAPQYSPSTGHFDDLTIDWNSGSLVGFDNNEVLVDEFGQTFPG
jgi:hypothetical protein